MALDEIEINFDIVGKDGHDYVDYGDVIDVVWDWHNSLIDTNYRVIEVDGSNWYRYANIDVVRSVKEFTQSSSQTVIVMQSEHQRGSFQYDARSSCDQRQQEAVSCTQIVLRVVIDIVQQC